MKLSSYEKEKISEVKQLAPRVIIGFAVSIPYQIFLFASVIGNSYLAALFFASGAAIAMLFAHPKFTMSKTIKISLLIGFAICGIISIK